MKVHSVWCATALARRVLPVPGGPYRRMPFTCLQPNCSMISGGNTRDANARLEMIDQALYLIILRCIHLNIALN